MINFYNPTPTANTITTKIRPDLGTPCVQKKVGTGGNTRVMMVVGTVTDRYGAVSELCDRDPDSDNPCPLVTLTGVPDTGAPGSGEPDADVPNSGFLDIKPSDMIRDVRSQLGKNHMTSLEAVSDLTLPLTVTLTLTITLTLITTITITIIMNITVTIILTLASTSFKSDVSHWP